MRSQTGRVTCGGDGSFSVEHLKPGKYELTARTDKFATSSAAVVDLEPGGIAKVEMPLVESASTSTTPTNAGATWFLEPAGEGIRGRLARSNGWLVPIPDFAAIRRRNPIRPIHSPFWPYGGSPVIGQPNQTPPPLMQALYSGPNGDWWKASNIQIYGWADTGFNVSSSDRGKFANAPAAYSQGTRFHPTRSDHAVCREGAGHDTDRSFRLGIPIHQHLRHGLPLHDFQGDLQQSTDRRENNKYGYDR